MKRFYISCHLRIIKNANLEFLLDIFIDLVGQKKKNAKLTITKTLISKTKLRNTIPSKNIWYWIYT